MKKAHENYDIYIEHPIENTDDDLFDAYIYSKIINNAIEKNARFIAIDGEFGSGKSSVLNLSKNELEKINKKRIKFIDINFLNTNELSNYDYEVKEDEESDDKIKDRRIHFYHRYFVNQAVNDICKNPFIIEKIFYNSIINITTTNSNMNQIWKKIIDFIIVVLISFLSIILVYSNFLNEIKSLDYIKNILVPLVPYALYLVFVLALLYGYGISKPEKQEQSPMLNIDRTRNNLLKAIQCHVKKNSKIVFIIDDLDRLDEKEQTKIISLLYNEYYPLNKQVNEIEMIFIFMINTNNFKEKFDYKKTFDFILQISNNQKHIIRNYVYNCFSNGTLKEIMNNCKNKELIIGIITNNYKSIRELKHIFNKMINKYIYLKRKENFIIEYDQMILLTILNDMIDAETLAKYISDYFIKENDSNSIIDEKLKNLINECIDKKIINLNYYLYLYNFIKTDSLFNSSEIQLYNLLMELEKRKYNDNDIESINDIFAKREEIRLSKIYEEIFPTLLNREKNALMTNEKFFNYIFLQNTITNQPTIDVFIDLYKYDFAYLVCDNIEKLNEKIKIKDIKNNICKKINNLNEIYENNASDENYDMLEQELLIFLKNIKDRSLKFENNNIFYNLGLLSEEMFDEIFEKNYFGWELYSTEYLNFENIDKRITIKSIANINLIKNVKSKEIIKNKLLQQNISFDIIKAIVYPEHVNTNVNMLYDKITKLNSEISFEDIKDLIELYSYTEKCDTILINLIDKNSKEIQEYINTNNIDVSDVIIRKFNTINQKYCWKDKYNERFAKLGFWELYIYSKINRENYFNIPEKYKSNEKCAKICAHIYSISKIYDYQLDSSIVEMFVKNDCINIFVDSYDNNKIGQLSFFFSSNIINKVLDRIESNNSMDKYSKIITKKDYIITKDFLVEFKNRFYKNMNKQQKTKITIKINNTK